MAGPLIRQFLNAEHLGLERAADRAGEMLQLPGSRNARRSHRPKPGSGGGRRSMPPPHRSAFCRVRSSCLVESGTPRRREVRSGNTRRYQDEPVTAGCACGNPISEVGGSISFVGAEQVPRPEFLILFVSGRCPPKRGGSCDLRPSDTPSDTRISCRVTNSLSHRNLRRNNRCFLRQRLADCPHPATQHEDGPPRRPAGPRFGRHRRRCASRTRTA